jgi:phage terminase large subunit-like protein
MKADRSRDRSTWETEDRKAKARKTCEGSLIEFVKHLWPVLEPERAYVHSWHLDAIAEHLEAITAGILVPPRLLINVPPGSMKSLLVSVFWPAWEWARGGQSTRYIATSFSEGAVARDCRKMRQLVQSDEFLELWPDIRLVRTGELSFENNYTGVRDGVPFGSLTSKRADRLIIDDPHSVEKAESKPDRERAVMRFREGAVNRLNDQAKSAIVVVMQRLNEGDISGVILEIMADWTCLVLPMEYESSRHCTTQIGFSDPRSEEGELLSPERFPREVVDKLKIEMGPIGYAGQYMQRPVPRGGGIIPYVGWELWHKAMAMKYGRNEGQFPDMEFTLGSVDCAFGVKTENDFTAMVVLGVWKNLDGLSRVMLMFAWQKRLRFSDSVEELIKTAKKYRCDRVLIENKGSGISVFQEIVRLTREESFALQLVDPGRDDKEQRANSVSGLFGSEGDDGSAPRREGLVYAPAVTQADGQVWPRDWAEKAMAEVSLFPKGKHDDLADALVQGMGWLRKRGLIKRPVEHTVEEIHALLAPGPSAAARPLYPG